jgi:hypothetical protein
MITDTAESRWKDARSNFDSAAHLDYETMTRLTSGLARLVLELGRSGIQ